MSQRPAENEYHTDYADYLDRVPEEDIVAALEATTRYTTDLLESFTDEQGERLHGTTNWTLKETLGHLTDTERIFAYRAMRIARQDRTPLPGYEQDEYVTSGNFNDRNWDNLLEEYSALRRATIALARSLDSASMELMGTVDGNAMSARALLYILVGHERRHVEQIRQHAR